MRIECLGTGGYHPNERRHTACILLPDEGIALDCGTSAFRIASRLQTAELDIFLSHAHLDHIVGLTFLLVPVLNKVIQEIRLHATETVFEAVRTHLYSDALFPVAPPFTFCPIQPGIDVTVGQATVRAMTLLSHPGHSMAYRIEKNNQAIAYVSDTTVDGTYTDFIRDVDLLIHECYFPDDKQAWAKTTGHSFASSVAELAKAAHVKKLLLTHVDPQDDSDDPVGLSEMRKIFPATTLAEDHLVIRL